MEHTLQKSAWCWFKTMNLKLNKLFLERFTMQNVKLKHYHWNTCIKSEMLKYKLHYCSKVWGQ